ncbi:MAG: cytidylate kinase [Bacteroidetes bacterium RBG_13_43_22]|nr:MAG: cytidylate kinase [Bacteroidetes bacterium RBG_13_43_22]
MNEYYVINIGRQLGSGGREIGQKIASVLGISFYDKELIRIASKKSGVREEFFEKVDEKKRFSLFGGLIGLRSSVTDEVYSDYYLSNESLFKIQSDVIRSLADQGSCIFVGRCADYVLKDNPRCLNIFISADINDRIKRVADLQNITPEKAEELIGKTDKKRSGYYNYFSGKKWGDTGSYHLCINSSVLGIDETAAFIRRFAEKKFGLE